MIAPHLSLLTRLGKRYLAQNAPPVPARPLQEATSFPVEQALFDPEHLDRVIACGFDCPISEQLDTLTETETVSNPPSVQRLEDVICWGGHIYHRNGFLHLARRGGAKDLLGAIPGFRHVALANSRLGLKFFGHWLRDDCAAMALPFPSDARVLSLTRPAWPDFRLYDAALGQSWEETPVFAAQALSLYNDTGFSPDKRDRLKRLRARIRQAYPDRAEAGKILYIKRGAGGAVRTMQNEDTLTDRLEKAGVTIIQAETQTEQMLSRMLDARLVIGVEGSHLAHAVYTLAEGGRLLALQPPDRFYNPHHVWARLMGMRYGLVVGHAGPDGFTMDPDEVLRMVDRLLALPRAQNPA